MENGRNEYNSVVPCESSDGARIELISELQIDWDSGFSLKIWPPHRRRLRRPSDFHSCDFNSLYHYSKEERSTRNSICVCTSFVREHIYISSPLFHPFGWFFFFWGYDIIINSTLRISLLYCIRRFKCGVRFIKYYRTLLSPSSTTISIISSIIAAATYTSIDVISLVRTYVLCCKESLFALPAETVQFDTITIICYSLNIPYGGGVGNDGEGMMHKPKPCQSEEEEYTHM